MPTPPSFLIFDSETVVDGRLLQQVRYPNQPELSPHEAIAQHRAELLERTEVIYSTILVPVSIAIAKFLPILRCKIS